MKILVMARILLYLLLLIATQIFAQQSKAENDVKTAVDTFFEGFHKGDTTLMKSVMMDKVVLQTAITNSSGKNKLLATDLSELLTAVVKRPANQKWDERLLDYTIKVDGTMANAWTPYEFWYNGNFSHCGVNSFQLFNDNGTWKIMYLIDTRRKKGCEN